jgi:hypothetical protein
VTWELRRRVDTGVEFEGPDEALQDRIADSSRE